MASLQASGGGVSLLSEKEDAERVALKKLVKSGKASPGEVARLEELKARYRGTKEERRASEDKSFTGQLKAFGKGVAAVRIARATATRLQLLWPKLTH